MSKDTAIQWCDSSVNPVMGCDGCELWELKPGGKRTCYAGVMVERYKGRKGYPASFNTPEMFPGRMTEAAKWGDLAGTDRPTKPWLNGLPRLIFVSDMGDALSKSIPFEYLKREIIDVAGSNVSGGRRHVWIWLTKRPTRLAEFSDWMIEEHGVEWPANVWVMTTVTGQRSLRRIEALARVAERSPTKPEVRGVSFEPLLEPVRLGELVRLFNWGIVGGESENTVYGPAGRAAPLMLSTLTGLVEELVRGGVATFVKQLGSRFTSLRLRGRLVPGSPGGGGVVLNDHHGGDWAEWPEELRIRQMPEVSGVVRGNGRVDRGVAAGEVPDGVPAVGLGDRGQAEADREPDVADELPGRAADPRGEVEAVDRASGVLGASGDGRGEGDGLGLWGGGRHL
jgi:protein gp37